MWNLVASSPSLDWLRHSCVPARSPWNRSGSQCSISIPTSGLPTERSQCAYPVSLRNCSARTLLSLSSLSPLAISLLSLSVSSRCLSPLAVSLLSLSPSCLSLLSRGRAPLSSQYATCREPFLEDAVEAHLRPRQGTLGCSVEVWLRFRVVHGLGCRIYDLRCRV